METKLVTVDLKEVDVHIQCGDTFIEWDDDSFTRHMKWVDKEKTAQDQLLVLREQTVDLIMEKSEKHTENKRLKIQLQQATDRERVLREALEEIKNMYEATDNGIEGHGFKVVEIFSEGVIAIIDKALEASK
jgi:hypothetical protein